MGIFNRFNPDKFVMINIDGEDIWLYRGRLSTKEIFKMIRYKDYLNYVNSSKEEVLKNYKEWDKQQENPNRWYWTN